LASLEKTVIKTSKDLAQYLKTIIKDFDYEVFAVLYLNKAFKLIILKRSGAAVYRCGSRPKDNFRNGT